MQIDTKTIRDLSAGIVQKVSDELAPQNAVNFAQNLRFDKILGRAILREGTSLVGAQIADTYSILGLHQFILSSGTKYLLSVCNGAAHAHIYRLETGTWTEKTPVITAAAKTRFLTYLDTVLAISGSEKFASEDGSSWVSSSTVPTACTATLSGTAGSVDSGDHYYKISFVNAAGETLAGAASGAVTADGAHKVDLTSIPTGTSGECTSRKVYRTKAGVASTGDYYLVTTISDNSTTTYADNTADSALGAVSLTTSTAGTNLNVGDMPQGDYCIEWNDRVYIAGVSSYEDRLYYSSTPTNNIIQWSGAGSGYIDIEPYEGQGNITALAKVPGYLLIFKDRSLKRWNGSSTYPDDLSRLGTPSQESVVNGKRTVYYFSSGYKESIGFYETNGETTRKISRPIQAIVEAIASANYASIAGFSDGEIVMWSIGNITWDGSTYSNCVVLYHIDTQTWTLLTFPTKHLVFAPYVSGTDLQIVAGDNDGQVIQVFDGGYVDDVTGSLNQAITYALQYHPMDLGSRSLMKEIVSIVPHVQWVTSSTFSYRVDRDGAFASYGTIADDYLTELNTTIHGHAFEFKFSGSTSSQFEIIGFDLVTPEVALSIKT